MPFRALLCAAVAACALMSHSPALADPDREEAPPPAAATAADVQQVIAAERAFAGDAAQKGVDAAFRAHVAPDGVLFRPDPVNGLAWMDAQPADPPGTPPQTGLSWWPVYAGIAASGDLGFTTGPWRVADRGGYYLTLWRRQADGSWKFALDHGPRLQLPAPAEEPAGRDGPVRTLGIPDAVDHWRGEEAVGGAAAALTRMQAAEDQLAAAAQADLAAAYAPVLADDTRMMGASGGGQPAIGAQAVAAELARRPAQVRFARLASEISAAGDLAYSYGDVAWTAHDGTPARGHYVRIWQLRPAGWRLVIDEIVPAPPRAPAGG